MAIPLSPDPLPNIAPSENCCFCFRETRTWYAKKDVAVCADCAKTHKVSEVPSKEAWCESVRRHQERIELDGRTTPDTNIERIEMLIVNVRVRREGADTTRERETLLDIRAALEELAEIKRGLLKNAA